MPKHIPIAPAYSTGDLSQILAVEEKQLEETIKELTDSQLSWKPNPRAKNSLDIVGHITYSKIPLPHPPKNKSEALIRLRKAHQIFQKEISTPGKLDEPYTWHTGDKIPYRGVIWAEIRHRCFHLGELVYLRQAQGIDSPHYYHDK